MANEDIIERLKSDQDLILALKYCQQGPTWLSEFDQHCKYSLGANRGRSLLVPARNVFVPQPASAPRGRSPSLVDYVAGIGTRDRRPPSGGVDVDYPLNPQHGDYRS